MMDELIDEFRNTNMPNRVHLTTSCCQINCGGQGDIAINIQHTKPPKINHDLVANVCERPSVVARCPVAAIRPAIVNGKPSLEVDEKKCICCGACYPPCPPMQINDAELFKRRCPREYDNLIEVVGFVNEERARAGRPPVLGLAPVGA